MHYLLDWLSHWYNLVFLVPLLFGGGFAIIEVITGGLGDVFGVEFDFDADIDAGVDLIEIEAVAADVSADVKAEVEAGHLPAWAVGLSWIGLGRIPLTIVMEVFLMAFGFMGLLFNALATDFVSWAPNITFFAALPIAFFGAAAGTRAVAELLARTVLANATTGTPPGPFVGEVGRVTTRVSAKAGEVRVEPLNGEPKYVDTRALGDSTFERDAHVILVQFDNARGVYIAEATPTP